MHIRRAAERDLEGWLLMRAQLLPGETPSSHDLQMRKVLANPKAACFVSEGEDGSLLGFYEIVIESRRGSPRRFAAVAEFWFVREEARGKGVSRALKEAGASWARQQGFAEPPSKASEDEWAKKRADLTDPPETGAQVASFRHDR